MTFVTITLAALLAMGGQNETDAVKNRTVAPTTAEAGGGMAKSSSPRRYCVMSGDTSSRMARKVCLTREEWLGRGFDPLARTDDD